MGFQNCLVNRLPTPSVFVSTVCSISLLKKLNKVGMVVHACNFGSWEAKAGRSL